MKSFLSLFFLFAATCCLAGSSDTIQRRIYPAKRTAIAPHIDGKGDDMAWQDAPVAGDFIQNSPVEGARITQRTETKIIYDDNAVYILGIMYDTAPDSIRKQLSLRDGNPNADLFRIVFDTYNTQQDAYDFSVTASGVQRDSKFSDPLYDAVWESAVSINSQGWIAEIKIPYSAIRFPVKDIQEWGFEITRSITRNNEFDQYALTPKGAANYMTYWGRLTGIEHIKAPLRLSLVPYATFIAEDDGTSTTSNKTSYAVAGGLDLKYGLNESFTLESTILPDFSQVQSDNVIKNLSAFETQYAEQRPFFKEGTELLNLGGLFYSRRIGAKPPGFDGVASSLTPGETVISNPNQATLLNSTKLSGRTNGGLGIGILNSVVNDTYAVVRDSTGSDHKILTAPLTNYSIVVFDQQMKHSSDVYIINTNVWRPHDGYQANVTGFGFALNDKKVNYGISGNGVLSDIIARSDTGRGPFTGTTGYKYEFWLNKNSGAFQFNFGRRAFSPTYQINDMGINFTTNFVEHDAQLSYYIFNPVWKVLNAGLNFYVTEQQNFTTNEFNALDFDLFGNTFTRSFESIGFHLNYSPTNRKDYYEPRTPGRVYLRSAHEVLYGNYTSNVNKPFSVSVGGNVGVTPVISPTIKRDTWYGFSLIPNLRISNRLSLNYNYTFFTDRNDRGYVDKLSDGTIIFGRRDVRTITNTLGASYVLTKDLSFTLRVRHYWSSAGYLSYYDLQTDGHLIDDPSYTTSHDFNFNAFNVDAGVTWWFAPGSSMSLVWKNAITQNDSQLIKDYYNDINRTMDAPQINTVSLKVLYYFDFLYLRKNRA